VRHHRGEGIRVRERRCRKGDVSPRGEWGGAQGRWESEGGGVAGEIGELGVELPPLRIGQNILFWCFWWREFLVGTNSVEKLV